MARYQWVLVILALAAFSGLALFGQIPYQDKLIGEKTTSGSIGNLSINIPQATDKELSDMTMAEQAQYYAKIAIASTAAAATLEQSAEDKANDAEDIKDDADEESDVKDLRDFRKDARNLKQDVEEIATDISDLRKDVKEARDKARTISQFREDNETARDWQNKQDAFKASDDALDEIDRYVEDVKDPKARVTTAFEAIDARYNSIANPSAPATNATTENKPVEVIKYVYVQDNTTLDAQTESVPLVESAGNARTPASLAELSAGRSTVTARAGESRTPSSLADLSRGRT